MLLTRRRHGSQPRPALLIAAGRPPFTPLLCSFFSPSLPCSYQASRDDLAVYAALAAKPDAAKYAHAARWYAHITALLGAR